MTRRHVRAALVVAFTVAATGCTDSGPVTTPTSTSTATSVSAGDPAAAVTSAAADRRLLPEPSDAPLDSGVVAAVQRQLDEWVASGAGPGVAAAVVSAHGSWTGAAGLDGTGQPLQPDAAMGIGSITKTVVAAEVMLLTERGLVDLGAPLTDYIDVPFSTGGATVRQVMQMISGFPDVNLEDLVQRGYAEPDRVWTPGDVLAEVDPDGVRLGSLGVVAEYNNLNYILLGMLIEAVTDRKLAESIRADLLGPAGLDRLVVQPDEQPVPPLAVPVPDPRGNPPPFDGPHLPSTAIASIAGAAGGMAGDVQTVARWTYLLYGGHIIGADLVEQMTAGATDDWYGLGTVRGTVDGQLFVGHEGSTEGFYSSAYVGMTDAVSVSVMVPQSEVLSVARDIPLTQLLFNLHQTIVGATTETPPSSTAGTPTG